MEDKEETDHYAEVSGKSKRVMRTPEKVAKDDTIK